MTTIIHIVPSGYNKSLCGVIVDDATCNSLGMMCNCPDCIDKANEIIKEHKKL